MNVNIENIKAGDKVTILVSSGLGLDSSINWVQRTGRAVMRGSHGWALNMGGRHGTPGIADSNNFVKASRKTS